MLKIFNLIENEFENQNESTMKAEALPLLRFLKRSPQLAIPIYQRMYSWSIWHCDQLWNDIMRVGNNPRVSAHFIGSIVYVEKELSSVSIPSALLVIDGQQRVTTVSILLEALARAIGNGEPEDGFSARKIRNHYLLDPEESGDLRHKLILTQTDKTTLLALTGQQPIPADASVRIMENFNHFTNHIAGLNGQLNTLCRGLAKLMVVEVALSRGQDNPQLIFESMNSTGMALSQADLIRNFVLMGQEPEKQTQLYVNYWRPMENLFGQEAYKWAFDGFMRHYLTLKTRSIPRIDEVYREFKAYVTGQTLDTEAVLADIRAFAEYYCSMALGTEKDVDLKAAFHDLRELKVDVAYPLLLEFYRDYATGVLTRDEMLQVVRLVESYVFRRAVCGIPTNSLNTTFANFGRSLKKDRYVESVFANFLLLPSYRRFPNDEEVKREMPLKDLYNFPRKAYWLRRLENYGRKERVPVDEYTIEHIMPQKEDMTEAWKQELGPEWERIHVTYLHTLGNLTLTGYNSEYGCKSFLEKRDMPGGFKESPIKLNQGLGQLDHWNEETIRDRAAKLAEVAANVWPAPTLEASVLDAYNPQPTTSGFSIEDHPHLLSAALRPVFEAFRKEVLAIDPCVTEEFLKLYVAYKAETNFVDIVPQAKRLRLALNMAFHEIDDPKGLCKDVTNLGRWGNGDVEVGLSSLDQLPYVMSLVRQSFQKQIEG